ncbi:MAG: hybrid sensor histidine kinase/response regulator [Deltaproteobacteria bacterium]|nr:hybrid sensor histidine kinase/response regulator [Deltaproteobacteria bacterium]
MDKREEEFLKRLKATFKVEADEHIQTISSGLLEIENTADTEEKIRILETIYREAHSLKGAARAVSLRDVEKICQAMESVLSLIKKGELPTSSLVLDTLLDSVEGIAKLISTDEVFPIGELLQRLSNVASGHVSPSDKPLQVSEQYITPISRKAIETPADSSASRTSDIAFGTGEIGPVVGGNRDAETVLTGYRSDESPGSHSSETVQTGPTSLDEEKQSAEVSYPGHSFSPDIVARVSSQNIPLKSKRPSLTETVRIQSSKLDSLLYQVEEMVALKMSANQRVSDLKNVKLKLDLHRKQWAKVNPELRILKAFAENYEDYSSKGNFKPHLLKMVDFLESNEAILKTIEGQLKALTSMAENDSRQASSMVDDLLDDMKSVLTLPSSTLLEMFPRLVRDLAGVQKKKIRLSIDGGNIEIDRRILEEMKDPLVHLVRNSIDHGLEQPDIRIRKGKNEEGTLSISISQLGAKKAEIVVSDDGAGIDPEKVKQAAIQRNIVTEQELRNMGEGEVLSLIFKSEVSTSPIITDLSGRGLGLAIVREKVERLGGVVIVESRLGLGTEFRIQLPVTLATFRGALVQVEKELFVVPTASVIRVVRVKHDSIGTVESRDTILVNGRVLSLVRLADVLEIGSTPDEQHDSQFVTVLILGASDQKIAFSVDAILNEQEVLVKSLGRQLSRVRNVSAATVLGSGQVALILNVSDLIRSAMKISNAGSLTRPKRSENASKRKSILVVEDSITSRMLLKNILESAGYNVQTAVDGADGWATLKTGNFDVVVSDIEMPRMDGFELTAKIRGDETLRNTPVVVVTSLESREDKERGIDVGANAYIVKSGFEQNNLLSVIKRLV